MSTDKLDRAVSIAANLAYVGLVGATLFLLFPALRPKARQIVAGLVFNYQLGVFLQHQAPVPSWVSAAIHGGATVDEPEPQAPA